MKIINYFQGFGIIFGEIRKTLYFFNNLQIYSVRARVHFCNGGYLEKETLNPKFSVNILVN